MLTKRKLAALIITKKTGGLPDTSQRLKYDDRDIWMLIDSALAEVINVDFDKNNRQLKDEWLKAFKLKLKWDCGYEKAYIKLPCRLISLDDDAGLHEIAPIRGVTDPWILQKNGAAGIFSKLGSNNVGVGRYVCRMEGNRVWVDKAAKLDVEAGFVVVVRMVCSVEGYAPNEALQVPDTLSEGRIIDIICKRLDEVRAVPEKEINDGNPNTP